MSVPVRVGIVGFGGSARSIHAPLIDSVAGLDLVAVVPTSDRAREAVAGSPDLTVVPSIGQLVDEGVRLAVIATPDVAHVENVQEALAAGMDVVVEKPIAGTLEGARQIAEAAEGSGRLVIPFQNRRWDSDFLTVRRLLDDNAVGGPIRFESRMSRFAPRIGPNWRDKRRMGMLDGRLADLGSHLVDQAFVLFGPISRLYAEVRIQRPHAVANDDCFVAFEHESGVMTHLHMTALSAPRLPRFRLQGLNGGYIKYGDDPQQASLNDGLRPGSPGWGIEAALEAGTLTTESGDRLILSERGDWSAFYRGVHASLANGLPSPVRITDAVEVLRVLDAADRSSRERQVVELDPVQPPAELTSTT